MRVEMPAAFTAKFSEVMTWFGRELDDDLTEPRAYWSRLSDIPLPLLIQALDRAVTHRRFFPRLLEVREDAEAVRQAYLKAHPYQRCEQCRDSSGFATVIDAKGVSRVERCQCFRDYCGRLERLGITPKPVLQLGDGDAA